MMHFSERNIFVVFLPIFLLVPEQNRIIIAFICSARPLTQPSYIIPTLSMRQTLAALAHNPLIWLSFFLFFFFFFWGGLFFPSPPSTRGYCLSKDLHKCFRDSNEISCMWTFMSVHAVSVSCVQTVTHSRKHSIRLDKHIQTGGAGDEEGKKRPMHIPCILATL